MAQAARLSLRMQKELKLLLTDPPPGAAFPFLSPDSDLSTFSLSTIHAEIQGPEGTVYEKGTFKINIQIPERYPFQPPIVTFGTPIYHPNIDNGGRICLDILNLPPKGAWQPSLNISTVLTSIGLLLSEPNPDDGLMCEASKEYKYNRQAFDHKARSLTEKYARCGGRENGSCNPNLQAPPSTSTVEAKESDSAQRNFKEYFSSYKKQPGVSRKLSLDSSGSNPRDSDKEVKEASSPHISDNHLGVQGPKQGSKDMLNECHQDHDKSLRTTRSLAVGSSGQTNTRGDEEENVVPHQTHHKDQEIKPKISISKKLCIGQKRPLEPLNPGQRSGDCQKNLITMPQMFPHETDFKVVERKLLEPKAMSTIEKESQRDSVDRLVNDFTNPRRKKLGLAGKKSSSGFSSFPRKEDNDNKENIAPNTSTVLSHSNVPFTAFSMSPKTSQTGHQYEEKSEKKDVNAAAKKLPLPPLGQLEGSNECHMKPQEDHGERLVIGIKESRDESSKPETVIVLDSEDSEEEREGTLRSRLSIVRKRLPGKWNAKR